MSVPDVQSTTSPKLKLSLKLSNAHSANDRALYCCPYHSSEDRIDNGRDREGGGSGVRGTSHEYLHDQVSLGHLFIMEDKQTLLTPTALARTFNVCHEMPMDCQSVHRDYVTCNKYARLHRKNRKNNLGSSCQHSYPEDCCSDTSVESDELRLQILCPVHRSKPVCIYCVTRNSLICHECRITKHKSHSYKPVNEVVTECTGHSDSVSGKAKMKEDEETASVTRAQQSSMFIHGRIPEQDARNYHIQKTSPEYFGTNEADLEGLLRRLNEEYQRLEELSGAEIDLAHERVKTGAFMRYLNIAQLIFMEIIRRQLREPDKPKVDSSYPEERTTTCLPSGVFDEEVSPGNITTTRDNVNHHVIVGTDPDKIGTSVSQLNQESLLSWLKEGNSSDESTLLTKQEDQVEPQHVKGCEDACSSTRCGGKTRESLEETALTTAELSSATEQVFIDKGSFSLCNEDPNERTVSEPAVTNNQPRQHLAVLGDRRSMRYPSIYRIIH